MHVFVELALGWVLIGSLIAVAVLTEHFLIGGRFPRKADWWLIPVLVIGWPWPVWLRYVTDAKTPRTAGLKLYDSLYPKELEPPDTPALNAMVEHIISYPSDEPTHIGIPPRLFTFR